MKHIRTTSFFLAVLCLLSVGFTACGNKKGTEKETEKKSEEYTMNIEKTTETTQLEEDTEQGITFPHITENTYWKNPSEEKINLARKCGVYDICTFGGKYAEDEDNDGKDKYYLLTDGKYSSDTNIHNGKFLRFCGNNIRYIFFDTQNVSSLYEIKASFTHQTEWAVNAPDCVKVFVSLDAENWYDVGKITVDNGKNPSVTSGTLTLDTPVAARFVCLEIFVSCWVGMDEVEIIGTTSTDGVHLADDGILEKSSNMGWLKEREWAKKDTSLLGGANDVYLTYHNESGERTVDEFLPIVAYMDADGTIKDTMYDGALFLMEGGFPSGMGGGTGAVLNYNKSDMEWLLDSLFKEDKNILALEKATGIVKSALGLDNYKVKYFVSLYIPSGGSFGDIDGDGVDEDTTNTLDRVKILKWWINEFEKRKNAYSFENIEFAGYYWYNESMAYGDENITLPVSELIHSYGEQFFWIPYFSANGFYNWEKYGFDTVCLQPNYAFDLSVPDSRIDSAVMFAKNGGMSIEIEMDDKAVTDSRYRERYFEYLKKGITLGYQSNCAHLYYVGYDHWKTYNSTDADVRQIYDNTYKFIKGTLEAE